MRNAAAEILAVYADGAHDPVLEQRGDARIDRSVNSPEELRHLHRHFALEDRAEPVLSRVIGGVHLYDPPQKRWSIA